VIVTALFVKLKIRSPMLYLHLGFLWHGQWRANMIPPSLLYNLLLTEKNLGKFGNCLLDWFTLSWNQFVIFNVIVWPFVAFVLFRDLRHKNAWINDRHTRGQHSIIDADTTTAVPEPHYSGNRCLVFIQCQAIFLTARHVQCTCTE